ncbi:MAG: hypothetical protein O2894_10920 [Planctomycetota bacterium]|nr:hypothetical protein [Planctomycetota bacterium]
MPHKWLRSYIARVKKELDEAVKVLHAAYIASTGDQGGAAAAEERGYRRGALERARAAVLVWDYDVLRATIVGWTKYLENDIGQAPDNR